MESSTTHQFEPALVPIRGQAGVDPVLNPPQSSGKSNQKTKPKKKKKKVEGRREETGGPNSFPAHTISAQRETSKKQDDGENETLTIISARDGQTWTFNDDSQQSEAMRKLTFSTERVKGLKRQGESNTFKLTGAESRHFNLFLSAFRPGSDLDLPFYDLKIILTLATDWGFPKIENQCITAIKELPRPPPPVDKLLLARRYKIIEWIREAYLILALRDSGLETADARALGANATCIIAVAREKILLHRLHILRLKDPNSRRSQCVWPSEECLEALREVRLVLLEQKTEVPKNEEELARLVLEHASLLGHGLCDNCKSDAEIARAIRALDGEISAAKTVFADEIGRTDSEWLENA
ncbi:hypothetical protein FRC01_001715 [Tulasnella sp. 417]|nr:hypothetical protein FRC01_001715 [Tulasnella sp. 417]